MNAVAELGRRLKIAVPRSDQQLEFVQHFFHHARAPIVPAENPFGGVAPAQEGQPRLGHNSRPAFPRNIDEQSVIGDRDRMRHRPPERSQHLEALLQRGAEVFFVGERARD